MATTETKENTIKNEYAVYSGNEFLDALMRMLKERTPIKIAMVSAVTGDIVFTCTYSDLGITPQMLSHPFYRTNAFANVLGELLVREHLEEFADRVMDDNYDSLVKTHNHRDFGLRTKDELLLFQFHVSLVHRLKNESISQDIANEVAKITLACPRKVKRGEENETITTYCDSNYIKLVVPKTIEIHHCFENAIHNILEFFNIKGKDVCIASNFFNYEIEIKDQDKTALS